MDKQLRQRILDEAIRIGDELIGVAERDEKGISWKTVALDLSKSPTDKDYISWHKSECIYMGVAGIVLFLTELYKRTKVDKYLNAAVEGMRWVESFCANTPTQYYPFLTGRMGVAYAMLKMYELTHDRRYQENAFKFAASCTDFLNSPRVVDELINGTSGTLLALMHLHAATGEGWLMERIELFLNHLIESAHPGPKGLYWDNSSKKIHGLCGFSHGAAGVGFVFLEAYNTFSGEEYLRFAEKVALQALTHRDMNHGYVSGYGRAGTQEDLSLFMGKAGVGYFYLRVLAPREVPSILAPRIYADISCDNGMPSYSTINISLPSIRKKLAQKIFRRTIFVLEKLLPQVMANYFEKPASSDGIESESVARFLKELVLPMMAPREREIVSDVFTLELEKWKMDQSILSNAFLNIKTILHAEQAQKLMEKQSEDFHNLALVLDSNVKIILTSWKWTSFQEADWLDNLNLDAGVYAVLLKTDPENRVIENGLSTFSHAVLGCFSEETRVGNAIKRLNDSFEIAAHEEAAIRNAAVEQIKEAVLAGILVTQ